MHVYDYKNLDKKIKRLRYIDDDWIEMLLLFSWGESAKDIGEKLKCSSRTIEARLSTLRKDFGCKNTVHLISYFLRNKIIE